MAYICITVKSMWLSSVHCGDELELSKEKIVSQRSDLSSQEMHISLRHCLQSTTFQSSQPISPGAFTPQLNTAALSTHPTTRRYSTWPARNSGDKQSVCQLQDLDKMQQWGFVAGGCFKVYILPSSGQRSLRATLKWSKKNLKRLYEYENASRASTIIITINKSVDFILN